MKTKIKLFTPYPLQRTILDWLKDSTINYVTVVAGRQVGKTTLAINWIAFECLKNDKLRFLVVMPKMEQCNNLFNKLINFIPKYFIKDSKRGNDDLKITFINNSYIKFNAASQQKSEGDGKRTSPVRGQTYDMIYVDEASFMGQDFLESDVKMTINTSKYKKMLITTTAYGKDHIYYNYFLNGQNPNFPNMRSIKFTSYDSPFSDKSWLDEQKNMMSELTYRQEILCDFVDSMNMFGDIEKLAILREQNEPIAGDNYYFGIDLGLKEDATVIAITNDRKEVVKIYRFVKETAPYIQTKIVELWKYWKPKNGYIEINSLGEAIYQNINDDIDIEPFYTSAKSKSEILTNLIVACQNADIKFVADMDLINEFSTFKAVVKDNYTKFEASSGRHDDIVMAVAISLKCQMDNETNYTIYGVRY